MILNEDNYIEVINSYDRTHWKPLLDVIPTMELNIRSGKMSDYVVENFRSLVYELGIVVSFDWPAWDDGREIARNNEFDFDSIDIPTKCKLVSAIIRNDRFCEGALIGALESGFILKILQSINRQLME